MGPWRDTSDSAGDLLEQRMQALERVLAGGNRRVRRVPRVQSEFTKEM